MANGAFLIFITPCVRAASAVGSSVQNPGIGDESALITKTRGLLTNRTFRALTTILAITAITTGCGGGGDDSDPRSVSAMPLAIAADAAASIGKLVPRIADAVPTAV